MQADQGPEGLARMDQPASSTVDVDRDANADASSSASVLQTPSVTPSERQEAETSLDTDGETGSLSAPSLFSLGLSVDDDTDTSSETGHLETQSSTVSVTSSIYEFVEEHGRTFHRYKEGRYWLPNDQQEQERLDLQHMISLKLFGGQLALAPIGKPTRVLDIGTGTGLWAVEFANEHPDAEVIGTDLSPIQPDFAPKNCRFEIDDAEDDWTFDRPFDYIHARYMCSAFKSFPKVFSSIFSHLQPGGVVEFQDYFAKMQCVDDSLYGTALERWNNYLLEGARKMGRNGLAAASYKKWMLEAGFEDVVEKKFALPGNPWAKGRTQKQLGLMQMTNILGGIHGMSITLFTKVLGMSVGDVEELLVDVRKDLQDRRIHFYYVVYAVWGRKPGHPVQSGISASSGAPGIGDIEV